MTVAASFHSTRKHRPWQEPVFISILLWALDILYFWPQAVLGRALYWGDIGLYFSPMLSFLHTHLLKGNFPLWNPWLLCGTPYVGNPQTWPLYPFSCLLRVMSTPAFVNWTIIFHVWFAALGTYLFLRHALERSAVASLFGAVVFAFGGQLVSKEQFPNMVQAIAYLPWVLWWTGRFVATRRIPDALRLGLLLGLQLLAAHAQIVLLTLYLACAYGIRLLVAQARPAVCEWRRLAAGVLLAGFAAIGLAAGQLLPTIELFRDASRQRLSFGVVDRFYLPGNQIGNFILPTLHGHPLYGDFTARGNFWETCCFVGVIAFALAFFGGWSALTAPSARPERFWVGVALVGLLMALGGQTWRGDRSSFGLYWLAYHVLPGFRNFHDPARCLLWCSFALAILASGGVERLESMSTLLPRRPLLTVLLVAICFAELLHFGRSMYPLADPMTLHPISPMIVRVGADPEFQAHQARVLAPDTARVWQRFTGHQSYRQTESGYQARWADTLTPNLLMSYRLADAYGYEPVARADTQMIAGIAAQSFGASAASWEKSGGAAWAGFLSVRDVSVLRVQAPNAGLPGLSLLSSERTLPPLGAAADPARLYLMRNNRWLPRARLMTDFRSVDTPGQSLALMTRAHRHPASFDLGRIVVLTGSIPFPSVSGRPTTAKITSDEPDRVEVTAETSAPAVLVLADTRHPGWRVDVNGHPATLLTANACLRAVALPAKGRYDVVFVDRPTSFLCGLYLSLLTITVLCGSAAFFLMQPRKIS